MEIPARTMTQKKMVRVSKVNLIVVEVAVVMEEEETMMMTMEDHQSHRSVRTRMIAMRRKRSTLQSSRQLSM